MTWGRTLTTQIAPDAPVIRDGEDETELKLQFARAVFRLKDDWRKAGFSVFQGPDNYGRAMQAVGWINDPTVQIELDRLRETPAETLPSDDEIEQLLWSIAQDASHPVKDRTGAVALILEKRGSIKRGANVNVNNGTITNNVLRVPAKPQTEEERQLFAQRLKTSQLKLVADARSSK